MDLKLNEDQSMMKKVAADFLKAGPGTDYKHPLMAHSVLAHTLYQYLGTPLHHKREMVDALFPRKAAKSAVA